MNSSNMLSAHKVRLHGMTSKKWTTKDKITQYKGLINLYTRDKKIIEMDTAIEQKKQTKEIKIIQKQIDINRKALDNAIRGDKQKLRNTLAEHREMQLAYQNSQPQKVIDMVHQVNFTRRKTRDMLKYRMKQRSDRLVELKLKQALYEDNLKYNSMSYWHTMIPCEREAHLITGMVQDAILKKEAAIYIRNSYKEMIAIMKRDAIYFDAILLSIVNDGVAQGKCLINGTKLGQLGTEYLDDRRQEFKLLEKLVKKDMISRKRDLTTVRKNVESFSLNIKNLLRRDSDINLGTVEIPDTPSFTELQEDVTAIEGTLTYLKNSIFTPTIESIYPCLQEQKRNQIRLTDFVEKCEKDKEILQKKVRHASTIQSELENTMVATTTQYKTDKTDLLENIEQQLTRKNDLDILIKSRYNVMANIRIALKHLQLLTKILSTGRTETGLDVMFRKLGEESMPQAPSVEELDATQIIPDLVVKFGKVVGKTGEILTGAEMEEGYKIFEVMMDERGRQQQVDLVMSEESLIETVFTDAQVLTRDDIKKQSAEIVALNSVVDEPLAAPVKKKKKF